MYYVIMMSCLYSPLHAELTRVAMEMVWMNMETQHFNLVHHPVTLPSDVSTQPYFLLVICVYDIVYRVYGLVSY
jgi:hypothetical protein